MNIYLFIAAAIHGIVMLILFIAVILQLRRWHQMNKYLNKDTSWFNETNRTFLFLRRSTATFFVAVISEGLTIWLLWMAGCFDHI